MDRKLKQQILLNAKATKNLLEDFSSRMEKAEKRKVKLKKFNSNCEKKDWKAKNKNLNDNSKGLNICVISVLEDRNLCRK